jgi:hypothetical protein
MRTILISLMTLVLLGCGGKEPDLKGRRAYWEGELARNAPVGSSKDAILTWAASRGVHFNDDHTQQRLYANVEQIPEPGIPFPCSEWNIIVQISMDSNNRSTSNNVSQVGSCL